MKCETLSFKIPSRNGSVLHFVGVMGILLLVLSLARTNQSPTPITDSESVVWLCREQYWPFSFATLLLFFSLLLDFYLVIPTLTCFKLPMTILLLINA